MNPLRVAMTRLNSPSVSFGMGSMVETFSPLAICSRLMIAVPLAWRPASGI